MESYTFRKCTLNKLEEWFGVRRTFSSSVLDGWLGAEDECSNFERATLDYLQQRLIIYVEIWNEHELALNFIGPLLGLVDLSELYQFNLFSQRRIEAVLTGIEKEIELSGDPDGMVATGYWEPKTPLFAFTEYKRLLDPNGDPAGQTLAAMLVAQHLNEQPKPLYGCYVVGQSWRFMVLEGKEYIISRDYSALSDEIYDIFRVLKALKQIVIELTRVAR